MPAVAAFKGGVDGRSAIVGFQAFMTTGGVRRYIDRMLCIIMVDITLLA